MTFESLGLSAPLLRALTDLGYTAPTPVQMKAIPAALEGGDWMVSSQTGSGKTAAFLIPMLNPMIEAEATAPRGAFPAGPQLLVLCPTRELAQQVSAEAMKLVRHSRGVRVATVVGGMPFGKQIAQLKGANLVVATPGRLLDLASRRQLRLDTVERMVVDEADRMLDLGFAEDLEAIHRHCEGRKQTMMFSATFAPRIMELAARVMRNPGRLELATAQDVHRDISQKLHWADNLGHKKRLLTHWLQIPEMGQALVFASTQIDTESLADELAAAGHSVAALHGAMPQNIRNRRLKSLRDGEIKILVATDVAARGIDVPTISHVINFGLPMKAEDYVHRIGRTGRAGRTGTAITLADFRDRSKIHAIERFTQQTLSVTEIPGLEPSPQANRNSRPSGGGYRAEGGGYRSDRGGRPSGGGYQGRSEGAPRPAGGGYQGRSDSASRPAGGGYQGRSDSASRPAGGGYQGRSDGAPRPAGGGYQGRSDSAPRPAGGGYQGRSEGASRPAGGGYRSEGAGRPAGGGYQGRSEQPRREGGYSNGSADRRPSSFGDKPAAAAPRVEWTSRRREPEAQD